MTTKVTQATVVDSDRVMTSQVVFTDDNGVPTTSYYTLPVPEAFTEYNTVVFTDESGAKQTSTFMVVGNSEGDVTTVRGSLQTNAAVANRFAAKNKKKFVSVVVVGVVIVAAAV